MKKIALLAVAVMATGLAAGLTSCGETVVSYKGVNTPITVWAPTEEVPVIEELVKEYNKQQTEDSAKFNIKKIAPVSEADGGTTLAKDPTAEDYPALVACADDHINNLVKKGVIAEIGGSYGTKVKENNSPVSVKGASNGGKLYGFPITSDNGYFLWYDSSALTSAQAGKLETILETAHAAKKNIVMEVNNGWYVNSFFQSPQACGTDGLNFYNNDKGDVYYHINWDNAAGVKVATYIGGLLKQYYDAGTLVLGANAEILKGFQNDDTIAAISGTWMEAQLLEACPEIAATKLPTYTIDSKDYQMATFTGSKIYVVNKTATVNEQRAGAALADLLTNKDSQLKRYAVRKSIPCNNEAKLDEAYTANPSISGVALDAQVQAAAAIQATSAEGNYWDIGKAIGQALVDGNFGEGITTWQDFLTSQCDILREPKE